MRPKEKYLKMILRIWVCYNARKSPRMMLVALFVVVETMKTTIKSYFVSIVLCLCTSLALALRNWLNMTGCAITVWLLGSKKGKWLSASCALKREDLWNLRTFSVAIKSFMSIKYLASRRKQANLNKRGSKRWQKRIKSFMSKSLKL
jgi:hypothetical protein